MDTLEALRYCRKENQHILSIVNVPESTIARESDAVMLTQAGPEIGVASTKAFTTQLTVLACLAIGAAKARGHLTDKREFYQLLSYTGDRNLRRQLAEWEAFYNYHRPHGVFRGKTPYEILKKKLAA